jgi:methylmalonyl-CoA mutase
MDKFSEKGLGNFSSSFEITDKMSEKIFVIPPNRVRYLSEISENNRDYDKWVINQKEVAQKLYALQKSLDILSDSSDDVLSQIKSEYETLLLELHPKNKILIDSWEKVQKKYKEHLFKYKVRDKELSVETHSKSLSQTDIPKISLPKYEAWGDILKWQLQENVPGEFPYTAGLFPFKREGEDPTRMFAGEGGPERTNKRFHLVSLGMPAKRLSTAFDSVTLYGNDPGKRPDIYGKIGNAGVSICCLDDLNKLY